ncbi:NYN domain-containing protein [Patescibacteria group bacterium]|nr:NYN domain-containing protein [Patescibacteria group bacterium]
MSKIILFIDGENFINKVEEVLRKQEIDKGRIDLTSIDVSKLLKEVLKGLNISRKIFYAAKLHSHPETRKKSEELISFQRKLRNNLIKYDYEFIIAGNVRAQKIGNKPIFREKGVDVRIAVDLVSLACDGKLNTAILCSSDSDLQPAVKELKQRGVEVIYLGFENNPNKGITYATDRTILLRNSEVIEACPQLVKKRS